MTLYATAIVLPALALACPAFTPSAPADDPNPVLLPVVSAANPNPKRLPTLGVRQSGAGTSMPLVWATFPEVPGFTCEAWCYESEMDFVGARPLPDGALELRHRDRRNAHVLVVTTVTPSRGCVQFKARLQLDSRADTSARLPDQPPFTNMCWQLGRAPAFASAPDPYPEFVTRCFLFTEKGRTFLDRTRRLKIPVEPEGALHNSPPWVQMYVGTWQPVPSAAPHQWAAYSPDRYTTSIIGVVSRDRRYLAAIANDSGSVMAQAWHDCLHNNAEWQPASAPPGERSWRVAIYVMKNDSAALVKRAAADFPNLRRPPITK